MNVIPARLGVQQRVLPAYRVDFFDMLSDACQGGLNVFAGQPRPEEALGASGFLKRSGYTPAKNRHIGRGALYLCWQGGLLDWLEDWQPSVLVAEANPRYTSTPAAMRWMHARKRPVIGWGLGAPAGSAFWRMFWRKRFLGGFDALLTYSQTGAAQYREMGFPAERIFVAPNAVSPKPTHPLPERSAEFRNGRAEILFVGRLQQRKRLEVLLRACAALSDELRPRLRIVGEGPVRAELEALAAQVYPAAEFAGEQHGTDLEAYFRSADLFVLPGTGGLAVQQAMSFGLPVMVAEADGTQADLVREENGWILPPGDESALIDCLKTALSSSLRLREMGAASYRIVLQEKNLENMVDVFARAVNEVTANKKMGSV